MANIRVDIDYTIIDGSEVVFRSPVNCSAITGLRVYYPVSSGTTTSKDFALADAHGNNVGNIDHLFAEDVVVKVILDVTKGMAFVQNADTNAYLEGELAKKYSPTNKPTAADVGAATAGHTHSLGMNPIASTSEDTVANWIAKGVGFAYFNKNVLNGQPTQRGFLVNKKQDTTVYQEWHTFDPTNTVKPTIYIRTGQGSIWVGGGWTNPALSSLVDYVTATGTSGVWSYWKFSSGLCIAMGQPTVAWSAQETVITGQARSVANLDLTGIFTAVMGGTCSNVHRYVNCFVVPSGSATAQLWATTAANPTSAHSGLFSNTPMVVLFGQWK